MSGNEIDFVVTWVDGNDEEWRAEKNRYLGRKDVDAGENRYRDWENLKYWFRGVEKFTPWVRKIHFVTCGHLPAWLNRDHPKLHLVRHSDYMPEEYLPTFNSRPIELSMHKIRGLSEQFVYFNDDMLLTREMFPEDFFQNGKPCDACGFEVLNIRYEKEYYDMLVNNMRLINEDFDIPQFIRKNFGKIFNFHYDIKHVKSLLLLPWSVGFIPGFINQHLPVSYLRSTFEKVWEKHPDILDETSKCRFRSAKGVNHFLFRYWQFMEGNFVPVNMKKRGNFFYLEKDLDACTQAIAAQKYGIVCINDDLPVVSSRKFAYYKNRINRAFDGILGEKSSFES